MPVYPVGAVYIVALLVVSVAVYVLNLLSASAILT
jgi:hypothetical protein